MFGIMAVLLGSGDAFHLVPRAVALCTTGLENFTVQMGLGKWITSITMTILKSSPCSEFATNCCKFSISFYFTEVLIFNFFPSDFYIAKIISPSAVYPLYVLHNNQPHSVPFLTISIQASYKGLLQDLAHSRSCLLSPTTR